MLLDAIRKVLYKYHVEELCKVKMRSAKARDKNRKEVHSDDYNKDKKVEMIKKKLEDGHSEWFPNY